MLRHARSIAVGDIRSEITDMLKSDHGDVKDDDAIAQYLMTSFALWNPESSTPFDPRQGNRETDQCVSLQSVIMQWIREEDDKVYYMRGPVLLKRTHLNLITIGEQKCKLFPEQFTAIKAWQGNWWAFNVFSYKTQDKREMCYNRTSLAEWLKDHDRLPKFFQTHILSNEHNKIYLLM